MVSLSVLVDISHYYLLLCGHTYILSSTDVPALGVVVTFCQRCSDRLLSSPTASSATEKPTGRLRPIEGN